MRSRFLRAARARLNSAPVLDTYPSAAAYSLRQLRTGQTQCIRVRRTDNTEQDIGFVNGLLDTAAMLSFCGSADGFMTTWYDQSGNARHATQTTAASQPQIVYGGVVHTMNGKPSASFVDPGASATKLSIPNWHAADSQHVWLFAAYRLTSAGSFPYLLGTNPSDRGLVLTHSGGSGQPRVASIRAGTSAYNAPTSVTGTTRVLSVSADRANLSVWLNGSGGVLGVDQNSNFTMPTNYELTDGASSGTSGNMSISELILYASNQSANRALIETNINGYYAIY